MPRRSAALELGKSQNKKAKDSLRSRPSDRSVCEKRVRVAGRASGRSFSSSNSNSSVSSSRNTSPSAGSLSGLPTPTVIKLHPTPRSSRSSRGDPQTRDDAIEARPRRRRASKDRTVRTTQSLMTPLPAKNLSKHGPGTRRSKALLTATGKKKGAPSQQRRPDPFHTLRKTRVVIPRVERMMPRTITLTGSTGDDTSRFEKWKRVQPAELDLYRTPAKTSNSGARTEGPDMRTPETPATPSTPSVTPSVVRHHVRSTVRKAIRGQATPATPVTPAGSVSRALLRSKVEAGIRFHFEETPVKVVRERMVRPSLDGSGAADEEERKDESEAESENEKDETLDSEEEDEKGKEKTTELLAHRADESDEEKKDAEAALLAKKKGVSYPSSGEDEDEDGKPGKYQLPRGLKARAGLVSELARIRDLPRLMLPTKFHLLLKKAHALDSALAMYLGRQHVFVTYAEAKASVERICRRQFSKCDLRQLLFLRPEFYLLSWRRIAAQRRKGAPAVWTLTVAACDHRVEDGSFTPGGDKFLTPSLVAEREELLVGSMLRRLLDLHEKWVVNEDLVEFDPLVERRWHRRFDLENVAEIPFGDLPERPAALSAIRQFKTEVELQRKQHEDLVSKYMSKAENKGAKSAVCHTPIASSSKKSSAKTNSFQTPVSARVAGGTVVSVSLSGKQKQKQKQKSVSPRRSPSVSPVVIPKHLQHLSGSLLAKMQAKSKAQKAVQKLKRASTQRRTEHLLKQKHGLKEGQTGKKLVVTSVGKLVEHGASRWQQLHYLANLVRAAFIASKKKAMPYESLVQHLRRNHRGQPDAAELDQQLQMLSTLKCKYLSVKTGRTMRIARLNANASLNALKEEINEHLACA